MHKGEKTQLSHKYDALFLGLVSTFLSLIPTAYAAFVSNSVVLLSDFLRCLVEFTAIFLSWLVMQKVKRGNRVQYHYGFGKFEQLASFGVGAAMLFSFVVVLFAASKRLENPELLQNVGFGLILGFLSVGGNLFLWRRNLTLATIDSSPVMVAQARLFRAKTFASLVVVISLLLSLAISSFSWALYADPVGSLILAAFLLYSAVSLMTISLGDLLDRSIAEALQLTVLKILIKHESEYRGFVDFRSRRSGSHFYIELLLEFPAHMPLGEVQVATRKIQLEVSQTIPRCSIVIVPVTQ